MTVHPVNMKAHQRPRRSFVNFCLRRVGPECDIENVLPIVVAFLTQMIAALSAAGIAQNDHLKINKIYFTNWNLFSVIGRESQWNEKSTNNFNVTRWHWIKLAKRKMQKYWSNKLLAYTKTKLRNINLWKTWSTETANIILKF